MPVLGVALVGSGFALRTQLPAFRLVRGAAVRALVGRDAGRARKLASQHGIALGTSRLDDVLRREDIDLVCVASTPDLHRSQAEAALAAGKHVLCEKPLALDAGEAESMCRSAAASPGAALVDHQLRFAPGIRRLRQLVADGYLGSPYHAHATVFIDRMLDPHRPHGWWHERAHGGGALAAFASHAVDWLRWTLGEVEAASGLLHTFVRDRPVPGELRPLAGDADDFALALLRMERGVRASIAVSAVAHRGPRLRLEVYGSEGRLEADADGRLWGSRRDGGSDASGPPLEELSEPEPVTTREQKAIPDSIWARAFLHQARAIVAALAEGQRVVPGVASFADGLAVQRVLDAIRAPLPGPEP